MLHLKGSPTSDADRSRFKLWRDDSQVSHLISIGRSGMGRRKWPEDWWHQRIHGPSRHPAAPLGESSLQEGRESKHMTTSFPSSFSVAVERRCSRGLILASSPMPQRDQKRCRRLFVRHQLCLAAAGCCSDAPEKKPVGTKATGKHRGAAAWTSHAALAYLSTQTSFP